jgi:hypothetical protein
MTKITPQEDFRLTPTVKILADMAGAKAACMTEYNRLAADAMPSRIFDEDHGSDRQLAAEAKFFDAVEDLGIEIDGITSNRQGELYEKLLEIVETTLDEI